MTHVEQKLLQQLNYLTAVVLELRKDATTLQKTVAKLATRSDNRFSKLRAQCNRLAQQNTEYRKALSGLEDITGIKIK